MSVYVDNPRHNYGRMIMCHMAADSSLELRLMAAKCGVKQKWIQEEGTYREHFDICLANRKKAVNFGAKEVTTMQIMRIMERKLPPDSSNPETKSC